MDGDLQDELDRLAQALGRSVSLDAVDGRLLGHSAQDADVDRARVEAILTRRVPPAARAWQDRHGVGSARGPVRVPADEGSGMAARVCVPLRRLGVVRALLWVIEGERGLGEEELALATAYAGRMLALLPARPATSGRPGAGTGPSQLADLLGDLVAAGPEEAERLVGSMADLDPGLVGARVRLEVVPGREVRLVRAGRPDVVHRSGERGGPAEPRGVSAEVAFEAPGLRLALDRAAHAAAWARLGASRPGAPGAHRAHRAPGAPVGAGGTGLAWDDLGVRQLVLGASPEILAEWAAPVAALTGAPGPAVTSGAMLATTLLTYLDLAGDAQRTAAALSLHRTTLYYRLGRAAEALGVDLADGALRSRLHVALVAAAWREGVGQSSGGRPPAGHEGLRAEGGLS